MHVEGERKHSCLLPDEASKRRKAKIQLRCELLIPNGPPTEHGSQRYKASGGYLPVMNASMVIRRVDLMHLEYVNKARGAFCNDALLLCEDIIQVGMQQMTDADVAQDVDPVNGYHDETGSWFEDPVLGVAPCTFCNSVWYDSATGLPVKCVTCGYTYHQKCSSRVIKVEEIPTWQCAVCLQDDKDVCRKCGREWTMFEAKSAKDNDELVWCEGGCQSWWHQKCHDPVIIPIPKGKFCCCICSQKLTGEHCGDENEDDEAPAPPPPPRRIARKGKQKGPSKKSSRIKASGMDKPGILNENKNLPKRMPGGKNEGTRLSKMAWDNPVPEKKKQGAKKKQAPADLASSESSGESASESESASRSPSPAQQPPVTTAAGKRVRKQTKTYDVLVDGANDTSKRKGKAKKKQ